MSGAAEKLIENKKQENIRAMFDEIAPTYDFLNHVLSGGTDIYWRKKAVGMVKAHLKKIPTPKLLDVATGTGDLAVMLSKIPSSSVIGVDLSDEMLRIARVKKPEITFELGIAESLKFEAATFDGVTAGFGVRNFENLQQGLNEFYRVLKPGGCTAILEPMIPQNPTMRRLYQSYFKNVLPKIAGLFTKSDFAYDYLPKSVAAFPQGDDFLVYLRNAGFRNLKFIPMTFQTAALYFAEK
jgi:demethylmenaquinone methyltransferase / 2-methoxy-6-polyprenyl-1,4-benzoquinol methylase